VKVLIAGGFNGAALSSAALYDPVTNTNGPGAFQHFVPVSNASISDGRSNTLCFGEVRAYTSGYRNAAIPNAAPPTLANVCSYTGTFKADGEHVEWVDGKLHETGFTTTFGPNAKTICNISGQDYLCDWINQTETTNFPTSGAVTSRSYHPNGVQASMLDGSVKFFGHDRTGVEIVQRVLGRLHASGALQELCSVLVRQHLALGFMIPERPLDRRAAYRYALATRPYALPSIVLSLGDRLATRGARTRQRGLRRHLETARELATAIVELGAVPPRLLAPADRIAAAIGLEPGPALGRLVAALQEEQAAGAIATEDEAVAFARAFIATG